MFNSNVAPVRRIKEAVKRGEWSCACHDRAKACQDNLEPNHPGLKRCGTCGEGRPETRQLEKADYPALLHP